MFAGFFFIRLSQTYLNGVKISNNAKGSIRVDHVVPTGNGIAVEVKNYHIGTNNQGLIDNIVGQSQTRVTHLPQGMRQQYHIDIRGQNVSASQIRNIENQIIRRSNGVIGRGDIQWIEK